MSATDLSIVAAQIQKDWSPIFTKRLRESLLLGALVNKDYKGAIAEQGDTVRVSQLVDLNGQLTTVGVDADSFDTEAMSTIYVDIQANKRAVAAVEFPTLIELQSQIDQEKIQDTLMFALEKQINNYLYSLVAPSSSSPNLRATGVATMDVANLGLARMAAGNQKWTNDGSWFALLDSTYYTNTLTDTTLASGFYVEDKPMVNGQKARKLFGFNVYEDNSRPGNSLGGALTKFGLFAHPDFMHLVQQTEAQVKISDMHPLGKFAIKMSVDLVFGAVLGNQGTLKHYTVQN